MSAPSIVISARGASGQLRYTVPVHATAATPAGATALELFERTVPDRFGPVADAVAAGFFGASAPDVAASVEADGIGVGEAEAAIDALLEAEGSATTRGRALARTDHDAAPTTLNATPATAAAIQVRAGEGTTAASLRLAVGARCAGNGAMGSGRTGSTFPRVSTAVSVDSKDAV